MSHPLLNTPLEHGALSEWCSFQGPTRAPDVFQGYHPIGVQGTSPHGTLRNLPNEDTCKTFQVTPITLVANKHFTIWYSD